jgi:hypothetical protein
VVAVPGVVAFVFGYFAFRSRIKGVYFSIITQALTYAAMLLFFRNETGFGGNNGFTDFKRILGYSITAPETRLVLFGLSVALLLGTLVLGRLLIASSSAGAHRHPRRREPGHVHRLQPAALQALHLDRVGHAVRHGRALYVPQVGIINPSEMSPPTPSRSPSGWPGGRGTLIGPIIGAFVVNLAKSWFTTSFPEYWLFFLGLLFIVVTLYLPQGVVGLWASSRPRGREAAAPGQGRTPRRPPAARTPPAAAGAAKEPRSSISRNAPPTASRNWDGEASTGHVLSPASSTCPTASSSTWTTSPSASTASAPSTSCPADRRRRAALHHRPQRRRQDHHDGRHHRQDPARRGKAFFGQTIDLTRLTEPRSPTPASAASSRSPPSSSSTRCSRTSSWR